MKQVSIMNLSLTEAWAQLRDPVMTLAEEQALHHAAAARPAVTLRLSAGGIDAIKTSDGSALLHVPGRPQQALQGLLSQMQGRLGPEVALAFAADQSVGQQISLPQQPAEVLKAIVRNKVESLAPWPLAQCLWGMRMASGASDGRHVQVDVAVISRTQFDALSASLRAAGSDVRALSAALADGTEVEIELGGGEQRLRARRRAVRLARSAAAAVVLVAALGSWWIYSTASEASRLEDETAALMASLKPGGAPAGETPLVGAANRLQQMRRDRVPAVAVLNELSKLLPDNVHLTALTLDGDEVEMKGQGSGVPALIEILEASPLLQNVNFAAATELDQNSNSDAFALKATLEKAPPPEVSP